MVFCYECGFNCQNSYKFCPQCGTKVASVPDTATSSMRRDPGDNKQQAPPRSADNHSSSAGTAHDKASKQCLIDQYGQGTALLRKYVNAIADALDTVAEPKGTGHLEYSKIVYLEKSIGAKDLSTWEQQADILDFLRHIGCEVAMVAAPTKAGQPSAGEPAQQVALTREGAYQYFSVAMAYDPNKEYAALCKTLKVLKINLPVLERSALPTYPSAKTQQLVNEWQATFVAKAKAKSAMAMNDLMSSLELSLQMNKHANEMMLNYAIPGSSRRDRSYW